MVGNSMCVATVSAVVKAAFRRVREMHVTHDDPDTASAMPITVFKPSKGERPVLLENNGEDRVFLENKRTWNSLRRVLLSRELIVQARRQIVSDCTVYKKLKGYISKLGYESTDK
jgi:hypothetical protein